MPQYLPYRATVETLNAVATLTPGGSRLVASYGEPGPSNRASRVRGVSLRVLREPHIGLMSRDEMARLLEQDGWRVLSDEGLDDLSRRLADGATEAGRFVRERVVMAERA